MFSKKISLVNSISNQMLRVWYTGSDTHMFRISNLTTWKLTTGSVNPKCFKNNSNNEDNKGYSTNISTFLDGKPAEAKKKDWGRGNKTKILASCVSLWVWGRALAPMVSSITNTQLQRRRATTSDPPRCKQNHRIFPNHLRPGNHTSTTDFCLLSTAWKWSVVCFLKNQLTCT